MQCKMVSLIACMMLAAGCSTVYMFHTPDCTHENEPVLTNAKFTDGHHYLFNNEYCIASVNTKDGIAQGEFAIYYSTGNKKYWGWLDSKGHVIVGEYNDSSLCSNDYDGYHVRSMGDANMQNCQVELDAILQAGVERGNIASAVVKSEVVESNKGNVNTNTVVEVAKPLLYATDMHNHPEVGEVFYHDGKRIEVFQVLSNFVLAETSNSDIIRIDSKDEYVSGESLKGGEYKYAGTYTYETTAKKDLTVRRFKIVK